MMRRLRPHPLWITGAVALAVAAAAWLARAELTALERDFDTRIGIVHRVLSLRAVEHEAILAPRALLATPVAAEAVRRLPMIYPRILGVLRRAGDARWGAAALSGEMATALADAEAASRRAARGARVGAGFGHGAGAAVAGLRRHPRQPRAPHRSGRHARRCRMAVHRG